MYPSSPFVPLPLANSTKWLVSASTSPQGCDVFLTDMATVYRETLTEQEIIERAEDNESPIDPSKHFNSLLERLKGALTNQTGSVLLTLTKKKQEINITTQIRLRADVHLAWTFYFVPQGDIKSLVIPLARLGLFYHDAMTALLSIIEQKDVHITALREKLNESGAKYIPRKHKLLLDFFEEDKWRDELRNGAKGDSVTGLDVFKRWGEFGEEGKIDWEASVNVLGLWTEEKDNDTGKREREAIEEPAKKRKQDDLVDDEFDDPSTVGTKKKKSEPESDKTDSEEEPPRKPIGRIKGKEQQPALKKSRDDSDDEFADPSTIGKNKITRQTRQATPDSEKSPEPATKKAPPTKPPVEDDTTDDEEDEPVKPPAKQKLKDTQQSSRTASPIAPKRTDIEEEPPVTRAAAKAKDDATDTEEDEPSPPKRSLKSKIGNPKAPVPSPEEYQSPKKKSLKSKIGRKKSPTPDPARHRPAKATTPSTADDEEEAPPKIPSRSLKSKIGGGRTPSKITSKIGGKKRGSPSDDEDGEGEREKSVPVKVKKEEESQKEVKKPLTAEEKAMERRAALKRELEEKKSKEVKKVRKF